MNDETRRALRVLHDAACAEGLTSQEADEAITALLGDDRAFDFVEECGQEKREGR